MARMSGSGWGTTNYKEDGEDARVTFESVEAATLLVPPSVGGLFRMERGSVIAVTSSSLRP